MSSPSQSPRPRDLSSSRFPAPHAASLSPAPSPAPSPSPLASPPPASPSPFASPDDEPPADDIADGNDGNGADDDEYGHAAAQDLPLTMTASTVLLNLPRDATAALATAGRFAKDKVIVRFKPVGSAPPLSAAGGADVRRKITATQKFEVVVAFVRRALKVQESESVFLYINSSFAPALDEVVGNLHQCFKDSHDQLNVSYSLTPAFG